MQHLRPNSVLSKLQCHAPCLIAKHPNLLCDWSDVHAIIGANFSYSLRRNFKTNSRVTLRTKGRFTLWPRVMTMKLGGALRLIRRNMEIEFKAVKGFQV